MMPAPGTEKTRCAVQHGNSGNSALLDAPSAQNAEVTRRTRNPPSPSHHGRSAVEIPSSSPLTTTPRHTPAAIRRLPNAASAVQYITILSDGGVTVSDETLVRQAAGHLPCPAFSHVQCIHPGSDHDGIDPAEARQLQARPVDGHVPSSLGELLTSTKTSQEEPSSREGSEYGFRCHGTRADPGESSALSVSSEQMHTVQEVEADATQLLHLYSFPLHYETPTGTRTIWYRSHIADLSGNRS